ncbi:pentatricopeptide repeat-containing protein At1g56690, mitochondrial-like [Selaginella moellendorffii]|uniref:pentatricopeptide repeat-containing protein At1g56690, mitochondrial-like n=1 Tax=Selaginella moellendorffii TaxID=88036 RepID=UPI000D1C6661|nr:pentatricopeptide repeat-containing protein At1g56690, mitochondrial-like [Selaginella moellendorffii]|eukprot:XP_024520652.1 pentatricopeptide repeat-containing protein At1g56690, mitochondrial-like [Selaginella moellendorffii]
MPEWDLIAWNGMLAAYATARHLAATKSHFDSMPERSLVSFNTMLSAFLVAGEMEGEEAIKVAELFFAQMPNRDLVSCNAMLNAYAKRGHLCRARILFAAMPEHDAITITTMIHTLARGSGDLESARFFFDSTPVRDELCWNAMITAYAQRGHTVEARKLFDSMPAKIDSSWNSMLSAYIQASDLASAEDFFFHAMAEWNLIACTAMIAAEKLRCVECHGFYVCSQRMPSPPFEKDERILSFG